MKNGKYIYKIVMKNNYIYNVLSDIESPAQLIESITRYAWQDYILAEEINGLNVVMIRSDDISSVEYSMDINK